MQTPSPAVMALSRMSVQEALDSTLDQVVSLAVRYVEGCDIAGVTLMRDGRPQTTAFTDAEATEIDRAQYDTGDGPCLSAFAENRIFAIADTTDPPRWEAFARSAAAHGVCSTLSVPLFVGDRALGALNLYSRTVDGFADDASAQLFALQASVVLANSQAYWAAQALGVQLQTALESRAVIEQAKGVLVGRHGCDPETAFTMLRDESQRRNVKLREVASETVRDAGTGRAGIGPAAAD